MLVREQLSEVYQQQEEWSKAAQALAGIDLDSGMRVLDGEYKLQKNIQIAMLYLEDDDAVSAETYIKKASSLLSNCKVRPASSGGSSMWQAFGWLPAFGWQRNAAHGGMRSAAEAVHCRRGRLLARPLAVQGKHNNAPAPCPYAAPPVSCYAPVPCGPSPPNSWLGAGRPSQSEELELQYKTCYARVLDSKRRFLEAATRYYEMSQVGGRRIGGRQVCSRGWPRLRCCAPQCVDLGPRVAGSLLGLARELGCCGWCREDWPAGGTGFEASGELRESIPTRMLVWHVGGSKGMH